MRGMMRVFTGTLATETNTFAPMPTGIDTFHERAFFPGGQHPVKMQMHGGPLWAARQVGPGRGWTLIEGLVAAAVPNGVVTRAAFETMRDQILADLRAALPVDMVLLGLHGAMIADGYDDCEGELITRVREIVGPDVVIGGTLDPHNHMSAAMTEGSAFVAISTTIASRMAIAVQEPAPIGTACRRTISGELTTSTFGSSRCLSSASHVPCNSSESPAARTEPLGP